MAATDTLRIPFNGVDSLMRVLDEPARPQTIELEVAIADRLDDGRLRAAVASAVARHPMARARQVTAKPFDLNDHWILEDGPVSVGVRTVDGAADVAGLRDAHLSAHIDVTAAPPFRLLAVHEPDGDRILLSVSHVAFDGVGTLRLLRSISAAYAATDDPLAAVDPLDARRLLDEAPRTGGRPPLALPRPPARLAATRDDGTPGFGVLHVDLPAAEAAAPAGTTVNDLLMAAVHLTAERWNQGRGAACDHVSVMMPVNRRPAPWRDEVLANLVLSAQVTSAAADRVDPARLLEVVAAQTRAIKDGGVGATAELARTARTPVFVRRSLPRVIDAMADRTADTAVFSNLGRVDDPPFFGATGRGLWFGPPPRRPVILTVGAATAAGRLGLSLRWCRSSLVAADAAAFGALLQEAIGALAAR